MRNESDHGKRRSRKGISAFGLSVSTNTDIVAISAVFLSFLTIFFTLGLDLIYYLRGSVVDIFLPENVQFLVDDCTGESEFRYVGVIAPITYFNRGKYDDLVEMQRLYLTVAGQSMQLYPYRIARTLRKKRDDDYCENRRKGEFRGVDVEYFDTPMRVAVKAGSEVSREILYIADSEMCDQNLDDCVTHDVKKYIEKDHLLQASEATIELRATFVLDGPKSGKCNVVLQNETRKYFNDYSTVTTTCREVRIQSLLDSIGDGRFTDRYTSMEEEASP